MKFQELMDCYKITEYDCNAENYKQLLQQIKDHNITPVIGAGISAWAYPQWSQLLRSNAELYGIQEEVESCLVENQYDAAAECLEDEMGRIAWTQMLSKSFDPAVIDQKLENRPRYNLHIPQLFTGPILTTNFDRAIEHLFKTMEMDLPEVVNPSDVFQGNKLETALHRNGPLLIKLHGDILDPQNMVLTKKSYDSFYGDDADNPDMNKPLPSFLKRVLERNPILFLGCSLEADRTCTVIRACSENCSHFALLPLPEETRNEEDPSKPILRDERGRLLPVLRKRRKALAEGLNITPIWYPCGMHNDALTAFFSQIVKDINNGSDHFEKNDPNYIPLHRLIGRDAIVEKIMNCFASPEPTCVWVEGPAGIGKTEICKEVHNRIKKQQKEWEMPFIDVSGVSNLAAFFKAVSTAAQIAMPEQMLSASDDYLVAALQRRYFRNEGEFPPALYFDNWEDVWFNLEDEKKGRIVTWLRRLQHEGFSLLFSSQTQHPDSLSVKYFPVDTLDSEIVDPTQLTEEDFQRMDSVILFKEVLGFTPATRDNEAFRLLISQLEGHPLAIILTAMQARRSPLGLKPVLARWERAKQETAGIAGRHASLDVALRVVWESVKCNREAVMYWVLQYYSICPIPDILHDALRGESTREDWETGLAGLSGGSLLRIDREQGTVGMLLPIKKQLPCLLDKDSELWELGILRWANALKELLGKTRDANSPEYQSAHENMVEMVPQLCHIIELLMERDTDNTNKLLYRLTYDAGNYYCYYIPAISLLGKLAENTVIKKVPPVLALVYERYGDMLQWSGDHDASRKYYAMAENLYRQTKNDQGLANIVFSRGSLLIRQGDLKGAVGELNQAENLYRELEDNLGVANTLQLRGELFCRQGEVDKAIKAFDKAEKIYCQIHNNLGLSNNYLYRGDILMQLGKMDEAECAFDNAEKLYRQMRDVLGLANVLRSKGDWCKHMDDLSGAMIQYSQAEELFRQNHENLGLANTLCGKGTILQQEGKDEEAMATFLQAETLFRQVRDDSGLANTLRAKGHLKSEKGDKTGAQKDFDLAEELFQKENNTLGIANIMLSKASILEDEGMYSEAVELYREASALYHGIPAPMSEALALTEECVCLRAMEKNDDAEKIQKQLLAQLTSLPKSVSGYIFGKLVG